MQLRFGPGDDDAYDEARDALLDELDGWLDRHATERAETLADVRLFLDWRYHESTGVLDEFAPKELSDFLLEWCPRRLKGRGDAAVGLCFAVGVYADFMAATGRLVGGVDRAARLRRLVDDLAPTVLAETGEEDVEAPEPYELPFVYTRPPPADVAATAAAAPLPAKLDALRDYLGPDGKQLTDNGNLELADGCALVDLLDTGDVLELQMGDRTYGLQSTATLTQLNFILDVAIAAGAVRAQHRRLVPVKSWEPLPAVARAEAIFRAILEVGPLRSQSRGDVRRPNELYRLLDDGIVHWLVPLLADDSAELPFESFMGIAESVISGPTAWDETDLFDEFTEEDMGRIFEVLDEAGAVRWTDRKEVPQPLGRSCWRGGSVALTALGRHILPDYLEGAGYLLRRDDDVVDGDGAALIDAMLSVADIEHKALVNGWQASRSAAERVQMLTEAIVDTSSAASRVMGFTALHMFDIEVAEPFVRQLLDTPVAGHAALWLISRERADAATLASFVDVAVLVDALAGDVDDPEELCGFFASLSDPLRVLDDMWRHPAPETVLVLDALGRHLEDRTLAKAARKAAVRHRSWIANRG